MTSLEEIITESRDAREVKRVLSVKMGMTGITPTMISQVLDVSLQYVSQWKMIYETEGVAG